MITTIGALTPTSDAVAERANGPAWWRITRLCGTPFAIAVRTWSVSCCSRSSATTSRRHIAASGAAATSQGTSSERNQSHGDDSGEARIGAASKKYGSGSVPNVGWNRRSTPSPRT